MDESPPTTFGEEFLAWFRQRTERAWAERPWRRGTRWLGGLSEGETDHVESRLSVSFPPDYRLFLRRLHAYGRVVEGDDATAASRLQPTTEPTLTDWLIDPAISEGALDWQAGGLIFDAEANGLWLPGWGPRPDTPEGQAEHVRALVAAAPRLLPVFGHRFLLAEPCRAGNPVLSVWQSDIIIHGADLRGYLLAEFAGLLGLSRDGGQLAIAVSDAFIRSVPFWGEIYAYNNDPWRPDSEEPAGGT